MKISRLIKFGSMVFTHKLTGVGLMLTRRCNLQCDYCQVIRKAPEKELTAAEWKRVIDLFISGGHRAFVFTGGEPLLYDGLAELVNYASPRAVTSVITNGLLLDEARLETLRRLDFLTFSFDLIDGAGPSRKDAFGRLELIKRASRKYGFSTEAIVTLTRLNVEEAPRIVRMADEAGIDVTFSMVHTAAPEENFEYRGHHPELTFAGEEDFARLEAVTEELKRLRRAGCRVSESDRFLDDMLEFARGRFRMPCYAADGYFTVAPDGRVQPCHDRPASDVNAAHVRNYDVMQREVARLVPPDCTCFYRCFYNHALYRRDLRRFIEIIGRRFVPTRTIRKLLR